MFVIGERINTSRIAIGQAINDKAEQHIREEAQNQAGAGAHSIDVNAGSRGEKELESLKWLIEVVQDAVDLPLCIDSPDPEVLKAALPLVKQAPLINSITLEPGRLDPILSVAADHGARVIALCQSDSAMIGTAKEKVETAEQLVKKSQEFGFDFDDIYVDPLVYPLATDAESALATLDAIGDIMARFPGIHTTCGLSNVSYGLPNRKLVNRTFLVAALVRGLDSVVMDPTDTDLYGALKAGLMVCGRDEFCMDYISAYRKGMLA